MIRVGAVSYLNTKPLLYGIKRNKVLMQQMELIEDYPSKIAELLLNDEIDMGLVPVAIIPELKESHIVTDYCIATEYSVASVAIFSKVPMDKIETIILDYQSRTSVALTKMLMKEYFKKEVVYKSADTEFIAEINDTTAAVVIGDRALMIRKDYEFIYDLGEAWRMFTAKGFVFAAWVSNKPLDAEFIRLFNRANGVGVMDLDLVIAENDFPAYPLKKYYTENISYLYNAVTVLGLNLFLEKLKEY